MHRIRFNDSLKNIAITNIENALTRKQKLVQRVQWKSHFFLNGEYNNEKNKFGLPSRKCAPPIAEMKEHKDNFESHLKCRLMNPSKSELGKVSRLVLDKINTTMKETIKVNK